jgi:hypothetical protein
VFIPFTNFKNVGLTLMEENTLGMFVTGSSGEYLDIREG